MLTASPSYLVKLTCMHARNEDGETVLHVVAKCKVPNGYRFKGRSKTSFELLLGKGLDPLAENKGGRSSLEDGGYRHTKMLKGWCWGSWQEPAFYVSFFFLVGW